MRFSVFALLFAVCATSTHAQRPPKIGHVKFPEGFKPPELPKSLRSSPEEAKTKDAFDLYADPEVQSAAQAYAVAHFQHETELLAETQWTIRIENAIGYFIFVVVHALLGLAVWAAIREYKQASRRRQDAEELSDETPTELKVSLEGVALKTSLHGTVLLVLSLAFYFIYVKFIYGITVVR